VLVIGAGPAGLAATGALIDRSITNVLLVDSGRHFTKRVCPVDRQRRCNGCRGVCNVIAGFGGSVHYGDGVKLSRFPSGRRLMELLGETRSRRMESAALELLCGPEAPAFCGVTDLNVPVPLKNYPVASLSSRSVQAIIERLWDRLSAAPEVRLRLGTEVQHIEPDGDGFRVRIACDTGGAGVVCARRVIAAVGRRGQRWWRREILRLGLAHTPPVPSVGVRFECPKEFLAAGAAVHADFKTTIVSGGVKVKTFCFCAGSGGGRIKFTDYGDYTLLDGHVVAEDNGQAANFALLAQLRGPDSGTRSQAWIDENLLGPYRALRDDRPGKPVMQWYPDFRRRTLTCRTLPDLLQRVGFVPSLSDYQVADLASLLPGDIHTAFCEVFEQLLGLFTHGHYRPDVDAKRVAVAGLELESLWDELAVSPALETSMPGLYACGDCAGLAQGILQAAVSGLAAAEHIASTATASTRTG